MPHELLGYVAEAEMERTRLLRRSGHVLGVELERYPPDARLSGFDFLYANEEVVSPSENLDRPLLLKSPQMSGTGRGSEPARARAAILGWILD
jgi:hypothetical protein